MEPRIILTAIDSMAKSGRARRGPSPSSIASHLRGRYPADWRPALPARGSATRRSDGRTVDPWDGRSRSGRVAGTLSVAELGEDHQGRDSCQSLRDGTAGRRHRTVPIIERDAEVDCRADSQRVYEREARTAVRRVLFEHREKPGFATRCSKSTLRRSHRGLLIHPFMAYCPEFPTGCVIERRPLHHSRTRSLPRAHPFV